MGDERGAASVPLNQPWHAARMVGCCSQPCTLSPCRSDHFSWGEIGGAARPSSAGGFLHVEHQVSLDKSIDARFEGIEGRGKLQSDLGTSQLQMRAAR